MMSYQELALRAKPFVEKGVNMQGLFSQRPIPVVRGALSFLERSSYFGFMDAAELQQILEASLSSLTVVNDEGLLSLTPHADTKSPFEAVRKLLWVGKNYPECEFCNARVSFSVAKLLEMVDTVEYYRYLGTPREAVLEEVLSSFVIKQTPKEVPNVKPSSSVEAIELHSTSSDNNITAPSDVLEAQGSTTEGSNSEANDGESVEDTNGYYVDLSEDGSLEALEEEAPTPVSEDNPLPFEINDKSYHLSSKIPQTMLKSYQLKQVDENGNPLRKREAFKPSTWWLPEDWDTVNAEEIILGFNCPAYDSPGIARSLMSQPFMQRFKDGFSFEAVSRSTLGRHTIPHFNRNHVEGMLPTIQKWLLGLIDGEENPVVPVSANPRFEVEDQTLNFWSWLRQLYHGQYIEGGENKKLSSVTTGEHNPIYFSGVYEGSFYLAFKEAVDTLGAELEGLYQGLPYEDKEAGQIFYTQKAYSLSSAFKFGGWMEAVYRQTLNLFAESIAEKAYNSVDIALEKESPVAYAMALSNASKKELANSLRLYDFNKAEAIESYLDKLDKVIANRSMKLVHGHRQTPFKGLHSSRNNVPAFPLTHFHILEYFFLLTNLAPNSKEKYDALGK